MRFSKSISARPPDLAAAGRRQDQEPEAEADRRPRTRPLHPRQQFAHLGVRQGAVALHAAPPLREGPVDGLARRVPLDELPRLRPAQHPVTHVQSGYWEDPSAPEGAQLVYVFMAELPGRGRALYERVRDHMYALRQAAVPIAWRHLNGVGEPAR